MQYKKLLISPPQHQRFSNTIRYLNPQIYYPLNEKNGTVALDQAPKTRYSNNGVTNGPTIGQAGKLGQAYNFDGVNDKVTIAAYSPFAANANQSFSFIINPGSVATNKQPWAWDNNSNAQQACFFNASAQLSFTKWGGSSLVLSNTVFVVNTWYFVVYTWDGTTNIIYVNGASDNTSATVPDSGTPNSLKFGNWTGETNGFYSGYMQHFAHFGKALSAGEILMLAHIAKFA